MVRDDRITQSPYYRPWVRHSRCRGSAPSPRFYNERSPWRRPSAGVAAGAQGAWWCWRRLAALAPGRYQGARVRQRVRRRTPGVDLQATHPAGSRQRTARPARWCRALHDRGGCSGAGGDLLALVRQPGRNVVAELAGMACGRDHDVAFFPFDRFLALSPYSFTTAAVCLSAIRQRLPLASSSRTSSCTRRGNSRDRHRFQSR